MSADEYDTPLVMIGSGLETSKPMMMVDSSSHAAAPMPVRTIKASAKGLMLQSPSCRPPGLLVKLAARRARHRGDEVENLLPTFLEPFRRHGVWPVDGLGFSVEDFDDISAHLDDSVSRARPDDLRDEHRLLLGIAGIIGLLAESALHKRPGSEMLGSLEPLGVILVQVEPRLVQRREIPTMRGHISRLNHFHRILNPDDELLVAYRHGAGVRDHVVAVPCEQNGAHLVACDRALAAHRVAPVALIFLTSFLSSVSKISTSFFICAMNASSRSNRYFGPSSFPR